MFNGNGKGSRSSGAADSFTVIGGEARFHGVLSVKGAVRVEGAVEGDITDATTVEIGKAGRVKGNIAAEALSIAGEVVGDVTASRSVELLKESRVQGKIKAPRLRIDEGAVFNGQCSMGAETELVDEPALPSRKHDALAGHPKESPLGHPKESPLGRKS
ncbi:MAG: polymer-forming cytoskeletal protein [Elusimicrobia bacterium]|nr:polymer-forming cytoskeletal protein [Elusimicrobiota bacterium]